MLERSDEHHRPAFMYKYMSCHGPGITANAARYRFGSHALQMHGAMHVDTCMLRSERPLKPCTAPCTLRNMCIQLHDRRHRTHVLLDLLKRDFFRSSSSADTSFATAAVVPEPANSTTSSSPLPFA